jgi:phosphoglycolate phosphatase-like HAD superfamily hydrolase
VRLLLFDIDQTLINTGGAGLRALDRACLQVFGIPNAMQDIHPHGKTDPAIAREILRVRLNKAAAENGQIEEILEAYLSFLKEEVQLSPNYRVLPGILSVLQESLSRKTVMLGLATGNIELGARIKLERAALNSYFEFGGFGSDSEDRTELVRKAAGKAATRYGNPFSPTDIYVIGDTPLDIDAGKRAGFNTVGVATGSYSIEELVDSGATFAIQDFEQGRDQFLESTLSD